MTNPDTLQQLERNSTADAHEHVGTDAGASSFQPSEEWIDAFTNQCTHKLRLDMKEYARWRARGVRRAGGNVDDGYAEDMVASVLTDTLAGDIAWNPTTKTLHQHVLDTIRWRTRDDRLHGKRFKHDRIDAATTPAEKSITRALVEASLLQDERAESPEFAIHARQVMARLRSLAADDEHVLQYLDAIVAGARTAAEIMEHTNMSKRTFRNARDRLARLVEKLEHEGIEQGVRA